VPPFSFGGFFLEEAMTEGEFLSKAVFAAYKAGHVWPDFAACEAALESAWGGSALAVQANNLFGQKQAHPPVAGTETMELATREFVRDAWVAVPAQWVKFADWNACFAERMSLLRRLSPEYPHYAEALAATTGEAYVTAVSKSWSTDPERSAKVLAVHRQHFGAGGAVEDSVINEIRAVAA
jgi:flagellum-specific peptidoglycan hydrolase FlgJ